MLSSVFLGYFKCIAVTVLLKGKITLLYSTISTTVFLILILSHNCTVKLLCQIIHFLWPIEAVVHCS